jgi:hypothetical protein
MFLEIQKNFFQFWNSIDSLLLSYYYWILSKQNPLSKQFFLTNPIHIILIVLSYISFIYIGKKMMKERKKMELKNFVIFHNFFLVILSLYMGIEMIRQAIICNFKLFGNPVDISEKGYPLARILWINYLSKIIEFIDTVIMILKKNNRQISFLHIYHHSSICIIGWFVICYAPGGDSYFAAAQNSFIHVFMYSYYLLTALGYQPWYKKYLTQAQAIFFINKKNIIKFFRCFNLYLI